jgi:DsbC/DsbD-like thiol-disulfide interchange protein
MILHPAFHRGAVVSIALICLGSAQVAWAQEASPWEAVPHGAARLIAGETHGSSDGVWLRAGVEIRLDPGWHTYWRYPGDSGVPPRFDFAGSENVKSVTVLWPAPKRFVDSAGGHSIGYFGDVVFPLRITALDNATPSSLHAKVAYAICGKFCLPAEANLELALSGKAGASELTLIAAEARVPRRVPLGAGAGLTIRSVHREASEGRQRVVVEVAVPNGTPLDLLVEGPMPDWALPPLESITAAPDIAGIRQFTFDLDGLPPGAHTDGATLTFTAVSPDDAIEVAAPLN